MGLGYNIYCKKCNSNNSIREGNTDNNEFNFYQISTGGGFLCFKKEQLKKNYRKFLKIDKQIIKMINANLKDNYEFNEIVGYLPYYCNNCMILDNKYYFEMIKGNEKYIPEYKCKLCNNVLKSIVILEETLDGGSWADNLTEYNVGDLILSIKNKKIKIMDKNEKCYKLKCRKCNGEVFYIEQSILWD